MKGKKRISLLAALVCIFALVFSMGLMSACGNTDDNTTASGNWFYGTEAPADGLGNNGDYYLNTETLTAYAKSDDGTWTQTTLYSGHGAPENDAGEAGDLYLDLEKGVLYQKETNSLWKPVLTLQGEKGRDGILWFSGDKDPNEYTQDDPAVKGTMKGDFYLNTDDFTVWQLTDTGWTCLGTIKGNKGEDAPQFYNGSGAPDTNKDLPEHPNEGDLYLGTFNGLDGKGSGSRLYKYQSGAWTPLMEIMNANQIDIYSLDELKAFAESVNTNSYAGKEVHLKTDIHFETAEASSIRRNAPSPEEAEEWTPIGSKDHPFMGIFNGEGHTIFNLHVTNESAGFFGYVDGATVLNLKIEKATITADEGGVAGVLAAHVQGDGLTVSGVAITETTVSGTSVAEDADLTVKTGLVGSIDKGTEAPAVSNTTIDTESDAEGVDSETKWGPAEPGKPVTPETYYAVADAEQLAALAADVNKGVSFEGKIIKLTADIDLTGKEWTPIGTSENPFIGTFIGNDHKITGLTVKGESYLGLFGQVGTGEKSDITKTHINDNKTNLTLEDVTIEGTGDFAGALAGYAAAVVKNVKVTGAVKITGNLDVGGVIGAGFGGTFEDIYVQSEDENSLIQGNDRVGGIFGYLKSNSSAAKSIPGVEPTLTYASNEEVANNVTVKAPLTYGAETLAHVGGIVGVARSYDMGNYIRISKANSTATVRNGSKFPYTGIGGIVGAVATWEKQTSEDAKGITLNDCSFTGKLYRYSESGLTKDFMLFHAGLVGSSYMVLTTDPMGTSTIGSLTMEWIAKIRSRNNTSVYAENTVSFNYYPTDATHENGDENTYIHVDITDKKVEYTLDTREAFLMFANSVTSRTGKITYGSQTMDLANHDSIVGQAGKGGNVAGMYKGTVVKLGKNITMEEGEVIAPIGQPVESTFNSNSNTVVCFLGNFDGAGHSITNLHVSETGSGRPVGLFTLLGVNSSTTQTISNLTLTNVKVTAASGNANVGVVVGKVYSYTKFQNITITTAEGTPAKLYGTKSNPSLNMTSKISDCTINGTEVTE